MKRGTESECWLWTARRDAKGYGRAKFKGKNYAAHRYSYELLVGPIPAGLEIDHLCRNKTCVNPNHLEPVTPAENMRRKSKAQTHCKRGHEFTPENTDRHSKSGSRVCRQCVRDYGREYMRAQRELTRKTRPRLSPDVVRAVRQRREVDGWPYQRIADEHGISLTSAFLIATRQQWVNIPD